MIEVCDAAATGFEAVFLSMHSPWEVSSKADLYEAYKGYKAFLRGA